MSILGADIEDVVGDYDHEDDVVGALLGAARAVARGRLSSSIRPKGGPRGVLSIKSASQPGWRGTELAPGVNAADEGLEPLPFIPQQNNGIFSATVTSIIFQGQIQKPFRGERWIATSTRTGATATGRLLAQLFVGTSLQQADITGIDIEALGNAQGFGLRMAMFQASPGVLVRLPITISTVPAGADTVALFLFCMGRVIHS